MQPPRAPKIYHIVHVDRLASIVADGVLWCDAEMRLLARPGSTIGMPDIKQRRLTMPLNSRPSLYVGDCVPFYFCPRSVMLYVIHKGNSDGLAYRDGQESIVHLEADFHETVFWAEQNRRRWAFTSTNAASYCFEDYCELSRLNEIRWDAVQEEKYWNRCMDHKQAEFLVEKSFPWDLVQRIGVCTESVRDKASEAVRAVGHRPEILVEKKWYY